MKIIVKRVACVLLVFTLFLNCTPKKSQYTVKVFEVENGWGYSIFKQNKLIIRQQYIPSISSQKHFKSEKDAQTIGALVVKKLKLHKIPSITFQELENNISL